jgi:hypothetical protein
MAYGGIVFPLKSVEVSLLALSKFMKKLHRSKIGSKPQG